MNIVNNADNVSSSLIASLKNILMQFPEIIQEVRGQGLMIGWKLICLKILRLVNYFNTKIRQISSQMKKNPIPKSTFDKIEKFAIGL